MLQFVVIQFEIIHKQYALTASGKIITVPRRSADNNNMRRSDIQIVVIQPDGEFLPFSYSLVEHHLAIAYHGRRIGIEKRIRK